MALVALHRKGQKVTLQQERERYRRMDNVELELIASWQEEGGGG